MAHIRQEIYPTKNQPPNDISVAFEGNAAPLPPFPRLPVMLHP